MAESGSLTEGEMALIFVNWKELIMSNTKLLKCVRAHCHCSDAPSPRADAVTHQRLPQRLLSKGPFGRVLLPRAFHFIIVL